jgi:predicted aspartyl protease
MSVFEINYGGEGRNAAGEQIRLSAQQVLFRLGPTIRVTVGPTKEFIASCMSAGMEPPDPVSGVGLIDTGALYTAVDESVCTRLMLQPTGRVLMAHAGGTEWRYCYPIQVMFPGTPLPPRLCPKAASVHLQDGGSPHILLIGRDILSQLRLVYNGPKGRIEIAF